MIMMMTYSDYCRDDYDDRGSDDDHVDDIVMMTTTIMRQQ